MNTETGQIIDGSLLEDMPPEERSKYVEVKRDLSKHEAANMQIRMYSLCGCGSGLKFKFCCHQKRRYAHQTSPGF